MKKRKFKSSSAIAAGFLGMVLIFGGIVPSAQAQGAAELQQKINQLFAQINTLQAQLGTTGGTAAASFCPHTWTRNLGQGATGVDVMRLQQFLNADPDTRLAVTGAGSPGQETQFYGSITSTAVSKFQAKHRAEVLTSLGLVNPTGYFGPSSRAKMNALCVAAPTTPAPSTPSKPTPPTGGSSQDSLRGGEATLDRFDARSGNDTSFEEGQNAAPAMDVKFNVRGGDVLVNRVDVAVTPNASNQEKDPWDTFREISIWVDGKKVASKNVSQRSDWTRNQPSAGDHSARITGLDQIVRNGQTAEFTVAFSVANNVVSTGNTDRWDIFIPNQGIRARDASGADQFIGNGSDTVGITIDEEGVDDELRIRTSSKNPAATTFKVENNTRSGWNTVFAFDLDSGDSTNDVLVETAVITVVVDGDVYNDVVNDARLVIDGQTFGDFTVSGGSTDTAKLTFDIDQDLGIDAGDRVEAVLQLRFKGLSGNYSEGQKVQAITSGSGWEAEAVDDITVSGSATGKTHTLRTGGFASSLDGTSAVVTTVTGNLNDYGTFTVKVDVSAFGNDVYIHSDPGTSVVYKMQNSTGADLSGVGVSIPTLSSSADEEGDFYVVREGDSEIFTLEVTYLPGVANQAARLQLQSIEFAIGSAGAPDQTWNAVPASTYRTPTRTIVN